MADHFYARGDEMPRHELLGKKGNSGLKEFHFSRFIFSARCKTAIIRSGLHGESAVQAGELEMVVREVNLAIAA